MDVPVTTSSLSMTFVKRALVALLAVFATLMYLYGPPATPALRHAAAASCNEHAGGNFRSFRLSWVVGFHPHWTCWDAGNPENPAVSLGWWVKPWS